MTTMSAPCHWREDTASPLVARPNSWSVKDPTTLKVAVAFVTCAAGRDIQNMAMTSIVSL